MTVEIASLLTELAAGRRPLFVEQLASGGAPDDGPPASTSDGVSCYVDGSGRSALVSVVKIELRAEVRYRQARISIPVVAVGDTYSFHLATLGGTPVAYTAGGGDDAEAVCNGLLAALAVEPNHLALISATVEGTGADAEFVFRGIDNPGGREWDAWVLGGISVAGGGGGTIKIEMEAEESKWFPWVLPAGTPANDLQPSDPVEQWARPLADGSGFRTPTEIDWQGFVDTFNTGSVARFYVEIDHGQTIGPAGEFTSAGVTSYRPPRVYIGPASRESAKTGV